MMKDPELNFEGVEKTAQIVRGARLRFDVRDPGPARLPRDGLKPVQRRIVYAMSELGLAAGAKHKKSARTVGDVIASSIRTAIRPAMRPCAHGAGFRLPHPIVDGQAIGARRMNPKSFAAMRYTESRLTRYATLLLQDFGSSTVNGPPNFDVSLDEPTMRRRGCRICCSRRVRNPRWAWPPTFRRTFARSDQGLRGPARRPD